jgi:hypothetical protein
MSDDDAGTQRGHRHSRTAQQLFHLAAAAQVRGQVIVILSKTPEIDDALQPSRGGGLRERGPRIEWRRFTRDAAASAFIQTSTQDGRRTIVANTAAVGQAPWPAGG